MDPRQLMSFCNYNYLVKSDQILSNLQEKK